MKRILLLVLTIALSALVAFAQVTTGKLIGTVTDGSGSGVSGATIVITDNQTGRDRTVVSNSDGTYQVSQLEFGIYTVKVTANGFKTFTATELKIDAGREYSLNAALEVGAVTEQVTVTAGSETINSTNAELSTSVSPQQIKELPLNGRNPLSLLNLQAGVNATSSSINGQRTSSVNYTRDGLNVQDNFIRNGFVSDQPTVDDTGEFTIVTQNAGADQGQGGSTQVQLITPRGGKDFHGALYAFNRNSKFTANHYLSNASNIAKPFLNRNQFGGSISGPVPFPHFGEGGPYFVKDKTFFFFNYEGFRLANQVTITGLNTLLPAARNGTFTYTRTDGTLNTVNVLTGEQLNLTGNNATVFANAGGILSVDPIIQSRILSRLPTAGNTTTFTGTNFLQGVTVNRGNPEIRNAFTTRFDAELNSTNSFNLVFKRNNITDARTDVAAGFLPNTVVDQGGPTNLFSGAYRLTLGSNFSNEIRGGFQYSEPFFINNGIPSDYLITVPLVTQPENTFQNQGRNTLYKNIQDNAVYTFGNHSIRFGGGLDTYRIEAINFAGVTPTYTIATTANPNTPALTSALFNGGINATELARANNLRYLLAGIIGAGQVTSNLQDTTSGYQNGSAAIRLLNFEIYSAYAADSWRIKPNLTINLGLRYDLYTPLNDPRGLYYEPVISNFDNPLQDLLNPNGTYNFVGTNAGHKGNFTKADKNNFGPNISVAWSPMMEKGFFSKILPSTTVIRGGFRISYVNDEYVRSSDNALLNNAGLGSFTVVALNGGSSNLRSTLTPRAGFNTLPSFTTPTFTQPPRTYSANNTAFNNGTVSILDPNLQNQKIYEYNVGIQREIGWKTVFEARYVGNFSNELVRSIDYNQVRARDSGLIADFIRAQNNCRLDAINTNQFRINNGLSPLFGSGANPLYFCNSAAYNPNIAGSVPLTYFSTLGPLSGTVNGGSGTPTTLTLNPGNPTTPILVGGGSNANTLLYLRNDIPGEYAAAILIPNNVTNARATLLANPNTFVANFTTNGGKLRYNALQVELRRRFSDGLSLQANYTFQKILTDIPTAESEQTRVSAYLDNANFGLDYSRPQYDRTHTFNFNAVYELPFGKGKKFFNEGGIANLFLGGWQFSSIVTLSSGIPLSILDNSGTLNRSARSTYQSATSSLSAKEIKKITGIYTTPNGIFLIDPKVLYATGSNGQRIDLNQPLPAGVTITGIRGTNTTDVAPYSGQVFFYNTAGSTGNLPRNFINGPKYINWDAGLSKNIRFTESQRLQLRMEAFDVLNNANFYPADVTTIFNVNNTTNFGRLTSQRYDPRIIQFGIRYDF